MSLPTSSIPSPRPNNSILHLAEPRSRRVLVIGGGFLGKHLIQTLLGLGHHVRCFDVVTTGHDTRVQLYQGDITEPNDEDLLLDACSEVDTVFHTASLTDPLAELEAIRKVNVHGTSQVIKACIATGVRNLIYTSTTSVIFAGRDIEGLNEEQCPYPQRYLDPYSQTKAEAEKLIIAANGSPNERGQTLCTVSLRPHAIFGPRDTHFMAALISRARNGDITHMIGSGQNRVDFTYVGNVIHAMVITMHQLSDASLSDLDEDQPIEYLAARARIGGQCYFITNGEPRPFWQFINLMLNEVGCVGPTKKISFSIAYFIAFLMEWLQWFMKRLPSWFRVNIEATITRHMVCVLGKSQWYSCAKAERDLGYYPIVSLDKGLEITINYFFRRKNVKHWQQQTVGGAAAAVSAASSHAHAHATHATHSSGSSSAQHSSHHPVAPNGLAASLQGSVPKYLTRIHSVPTPQSEQPGTIPSNTYTHPPQFDPHNHPHHHTVQSSSSSSTLRPPAHPSEPSSSSSPNRSSPQWPNRHWSTTPPLEERPVITNGASAISAQLAAQQRAREHHAQLVAPHPVRGASMKSIPSFAFLNAYSHPQISTPTTANSILGSPPSNSADQSQRPGPRA